MRCFTKDEVSKWISEVGQVEDPHDAASPPEFAVQFYAPQKYSAIECFVRCFLREVAGDGEVLIVVTDSEPSEESQRYIHETIRLTTGGKRSVQEAPGYLFSNLEAERAVALFSLMSCFMKCYLYGSQHQVTLYSWEGEIFDMWTCSEDRLKPLAKNFELEEIKEPGEFIR